MVKASGSSDNVVSFPEIDSFMSDRSTAEYRWAKQVTFDGNLTAMNARSLLIEDEWRRLASSVRQVFPGLLTYGANFDEFFDVSWWSSVDLLGINAYFPLRGSLRPGQSDGSLLKELQVRKASTQSVHLEDRPDVVRPLT